MELKNAFTLLYVVVLSSYFEPLFSCDLQRMFTKSILAKHVLAFVSVFFLITLVDEEKEIRSLGEMFKTTGVVYALYILSTKAKAYFVLPMLIVLFLDQIAKVQVGIVDKREEEKLAREGDIAMRAKLIKVREAMTWVIVALIFAGMASYYVRARSEFGDRFSTTAFFAGTNRCAHGPKWFS